MPIYEYVCEKCGSEFEREQRITDDPVKTCPHCRSRKVKRLISQTSFTLKGGGWYSDLYSSAGGSKKDAGGASETKPADTGSSPAEKAPSDKKASADAKPSGSKSGGGGKTKAA